MKWRPSQNITQASEKLTPTVLRKLPDMDYKVVITKVRTFADTGLRMLNSRRIEKQSVISRVGRNKISHGYSHTLGMNMLFFTEFRLYTHKKHYERDGKT